MVISIGLSLRALPDPKWSGVVSCDGNGNQKTLACQSSSEKPAVQLTREAALQTFCLVDRCGCGGGCLVGGVLRVVNISSG